MRIYEEIKSKFDNEKSETEAVESNTHKLV